MFFFLNTDIFEVFKLKHWQLLRFQDVFNAKKHDQPVFRKQEHIYFIQVY